MTSTACSTSPFSGRSSPTKRSGTTLVWGRRTSLPADHGPARRGTGGIDARSRCAASSLAMSPRARGAGCAPPSSVGGGCSSHVGSTRSRWRPRARCFCRSAVAVSSTWWYFAPLLVAFMTDASDRSAGEARIALSRYRVGYHNQLSTGAHAVS